MAETARPRPNPLLKLAVELGPLFVFFLFYSRWGIFVATGAFMGTSLLSLAYAWIRERRIAPLPLVSAVLVLVLGGLTLWFKNDTFIKIKITVVNGLFGFVLLGGLLYKKPLVKYLLGDALQLADEGWRVLTRLWILYFFFLAGLNELVWRNTTMDNWVRFKTFALPALTLIFFLFALGPVIARYDLSERRSTDEQQPPA